MAERRMFNKNITESDAFLSLSFSAQALYLHLNMAADDDGFLNNAQQITRAVGAKNKDFQALVDKKFLIVFDSGITVIKHWKMNNYIQTDRYKPSNYSDERKLLGIKENKAYTLNPEKTVYSLDT